MSGSRGDASRRNRWLAVIALLAAWAAFGLAVSASAGDRDIELDRDGLDLIYEVGHIRSHDPWLIEAMEWADEFLAVDLPPLDLGPSLGVIESCP